MLSCAKEIAPCEENNEVLREGYRWLEVSLAMESPKTIIAGAGSTKNIEWEAGDKIDFFWGSGSDENTSITLKVGGPAANLRVQIPETVTDVYAAYPSGSATFADGTLSFEMPGVKSGEFREVNYLASKVVTDSDDGKKTAVFRSVVSFLKFTISDPDAQKIEIKARAEENPVLRGTIPVTFDTDDNIQIGSASNTHQTYTMNIGGAGDFYAPILPGKLYADGFELNYYVNNLNTKYYDVDFDFKLDRGYIATFGTVETLFKANTIHDYYVTVSGAGTKDGSSWSNALGKNEFKQKLVRISDDSDTELVKSVETYLKNALFHIEGGTYDFGELVELGFSNHCKKYINFTFDGGYYNGSKDVQNHPTVFDGGGTHRIFELARYADLAVMDCTFSNSLGAGGGEAAIRMGSKYSKLTLSGCKLEDNVNSATGGTVNVGYGTASITNCTFSGNSATYGAAISIDNGEASNIDQTGAVSLVGCTFDGNHASTSGAAIRLNSGGPVSIENCTFTNNSSDGAGGAMIVTNARETITVTNCTFGTSGKGNTSGGDGGAVRIASGSVNAVFDGCTFTDNSAANAGGISLQTNFAGTVTVNGGSFTNCSASSNGGAINHGSGTLIVDGASFDGCHANNYGGAYATTDSSDGNARFTNCDFGKVTRNTAEKRGGCIYSNCSNVTVTSHTFTDCWISGQVSSGGDEVTGGGARFGSGASPLFTRCIFDNCNSTTTTTDNSGQKSGAGAVHIASSHPSFVNCTFSNCSTNADVTKNGNGGAIKISNSNSHPSFSGCTFTNCVTHYRGGAIYSEASTASGINITNCEFTGCYSPDEGGAIDVRNSCTYNMNNCNIHDNYGPWGTIYVGSNSTVNIVGGNMTENIGKTGASGSYQVGAAIYGSENSKVTCDGVVFDGNEAKEGPIYHCGSNNNITAWFNSCVIRNNHWTTTYGCLFNMPNGKTGVDIAFNNCTFIRNYINEGVSLSSNYQNTWFNLNPFTGSVVFSNCTIWGRTYQGISKEEITSKEQYGFIRVSSSDTRTLKLINSIVGNSHSSGKGFTINGSPTIVAKYCLFSADYNQSGSATWDEVGTIHTAKARGDWYAGYDGFDALATADYVKITSLKGDCESFAKQSTSTINSAIQSANSGFYDWLNSIGALGKDCRGKTRNSSANWPGAYDNGAN